MPFASSWFGRFRQTRSTASRRQRTGGLEPLVPLEGRRLLSGSHAASGSHHAEAVEVAHHDHQGAQGPQQEVHGDGTVVKAPQFYEVYLQNLPAGTAPRQDLNVRKASARLENGHGLVLTGTMNANIDLTKGSFFVWGFDRSGHLGPQNAPFTNRPDIRFDAVVVVQVKADGTVSGSVRDLATNTTTEQIPANQIRIDGRRVEVVITDPTTALPSTGLPLSQYRFNLWPRVALGPSSTVVSFAPEDSMAPIGTDNDAEHSTQDPQDHRGRDNADANDLNVVMDMDNHNDNDNDNGNGHDRGRQGGHR